MAKRNSKRIHRDYRFDTYDEYIAREHYSDLIKDEFVHKHIREGDIPPIAYNRSYINNRDIDEDRKRIKRRIRIHLSQIPRTRKGFIKKVASLGGIDNMVLDYAINKAFKCHKAKESRRRAYFAKTKGKGGGKTVKFKREYRC